MEHPTGQRPLVSVIMPAYNAEKWIGEAVESVRGQSCRDWELLILDDASTDGTEMLARRYAAEDPRIRYERGRENRGVAAVRNRGLELARGSWVALLDSDDTWRPEKLERQLALARREQADIVYCSYGMSGGAGDYLVPESVDYDELLRRNVLGCSTVLLSERVARRYRFSTEYYHEDYALWLELLRSGFRAVGCREVLADYRVVPGSRSHNKLRSAGHRWEIYRRAERLSLARALGAFAGYAYYGLKKHKGI